MEKSRVTIEFSTGVSLAYPSLREFVREWLNASGRPMKSIAADMDMSPSQLSRKLNQSEGDSARLTVDDLERLMQLLSDTAPIAYQVEKFHGQQSRIDQLEAELEALKAGITN